MGVLPMRAKRVKISHCGSIGDNCGGQIESDGRRNQTKKEKYVTVGAKIMMAADEDVLACRCGSKQSNEAYRLDDR